MGVFPKVLALRGGLALWAAAATAADGGGVCPIEARKRGPRPDSSECAGEPGRIAVPSIWPGCSASGLPADRLRSSVERRRSDRDPHGVLWADEREQPGCQLDAVRPAGVVPGTAAKSPPRRFLAHWDHDPAVHSPKPPTCRGRHWGSCSAAGSPRGFGTPFRSPRGSDPGPIRGVPVPGNGCGRFPTCRFFRSPGDMSSGGTAFLPMRAAAAGRCGCACPPAEGAARWRVRRRLRFYPFL